MNSSKVAEVDSTDFQPLEPSLTEYTRRDGSSCELFKIEIKNIPLYANYTSIKKPIKKSDREAALEGVKT